MNILSREPIASAGTAKSTQPAQTSAGNVLAKIRQDIAHTREQLADASETLQDKAGEATAQAKGLMTNQAVTKLPAAVVLGVFVSLVLRSLFRRNR